MAQMQARHFINLFLLCLVKSAQHSCHSELHEITTRELVIEVAADKPGEEDSKELSRGEGVREPLLLFPLSLISSIILCTTAILGRYLASGDTQSSATCSRANISSSAAASPPLPSSMSNTSAAHSSRTTLRTHPSNSVQPQPSSFAGLPVRSSSRMIPNRYTSFLCEVSPVMISELSCLRGCGGGGGGGERTSSARPKSEMRAPPWASTRTSEEERRWWEKSIGLDAE